MVIKRIRPGLYEGPRGKARNVYDGNEGVRNPRARWLVTLTTGKWFFAPTLARAREFIA